MRTHLPAWAEAAIESQDAAELRPKLMRRWHEIEADVAPALEGLDDLEKQWILDAALWAGKYWHREAVNQHREAIAAAQTRLTHIAELADDLAAHLNTLATVAEDHSLITGIPSLWELLADTAEGEPGYCDWLAVMKSHGHWRDFIRVAKTQSRPGPDLAALLATFADCIKIGDDICSAYLARDTSTRKADAMPLRILIAQLRDNLAYPLQQQGFTLPDQAIATLAAVLFDLDPPPTADAVKMLRTRMKMCNAG